MGKAIVEGLVPVLIVVVIAFVIVYFRRRQSKEKALDKGWAIKGDLNARQERALIAEVDSAATLFWGILAPANELTSDMTYLSTMDRAKVERWLHQHSTTSISNTRRAIENS